MHVDRRKHMHANRERRKESHQILTVPIQLPRVPLSPHATVIPLRALITDNHGRVHEGNSHPSFVSSPFVLSSLSETHKAWNLPCPSVHVDTNSLTATLQQPDIIDRLPSMIHPSRSQVLLLSGLHQSMVRLGMCTSTQLYLYAAIENSTNTQRTAVAPHGPRGPVSVSVLSWGRNLSIGRHHFRSLFSSSQVLGCRKDDQ